MDNDIPIIGGMNIPTMARFGVGGALTGASAAAALNLVHMIRSLNEKRKAKEQPSETDENTIVLTIPKKRASADNSEAVNDNVKPIIPKKHKTKDVIDGEPDPKMPKVKKIREQVSSIDMSKQVRHYDGEFGKRANWQTLTGSLLAAGGGGTLGYMIVDKVYQMKRMKDKQKELDEARQEYLNKLKPTPETGDKIAQAPSFGVTDYPMGMAALALLLGGGSTAWLTKRVLDEYQEDDPDEKKKKPEVRRILFKQSCDMSAPSTDEEKEAAETGSALIAVYLDICSGVTDILGDEKCAEALEGTGYTQGDIYKMAAAPGGSQDYQDLLTTLQDNPKFRKTLQRLSMDKHPILKYMKWGVGLPFASEYADNKLYGKVDEMFGPGSNVPAPEMPKTAEDKEALFGLRLKDIGASFAGSTIAEKRLANERAQEEEPSEDDRAQSLLKKLEIASADPAAAQFVTDNKDKLKQVIAMLVGQGKL